MSNRPDPWLDQQLRQVPLPPGLLARLKAAGELTDEDLDEELRQVAIPDDLLGQLLAIPADAEVERRLAEVPVPSHLLNELSAIPIDERIRDVPMPRDLMVSLRKIAPRRRRRISIGQLATAASLLLMITASYLASLTGAMLTAYDQWPEDRIARFSGEDDSVDLVHEPNVEGAVLVDSQLPAPTQQREQLVSADLVHFPLPARVPTTPLADTQWLVPTGSSLADNYLPIKYGLLGEPRRDVDSVPELEVFRPSPARGIEVPLALGFDRQYLITQRTQPTVRLDLIERLPQALQSETLSRLGTSRVPLWTSTDSYDLTRRMARDGRLPEPWQIHVEDFLAAADYRFSPTEEGELAIRVAAGPSPFGAAEAQLLQVGVQAGDAPRRRATHLVAVVDVSDSMRWDDRLKKTQTALRRLAESLGPGDALSLVAFNETATVLVEQATRKNRGVMASAIDSLVAEGGTNLGAGLLEASLLASTARQSGLAASHLVLITDEAPPTQLATQEALRQLLGELAAESAQLSIVDLSDTPDDSLWQPVVTWGAAQLFQPKTADQMQWQLHELISGHSPQVAIDAALQVRFNPEVVAAYRLIGHEPVTSGGLESASYHQSLLANQSATALYEVWLRPTSEEKVADVTITWKDPVGERVRTRRQRVSRLQFAPSQTEMPFPLLTAAIAAEAAEVLRQAPTAATARTRDVRPVLELAEWVSPNLARRPEFQRLIETVQQIDAAGRRQGR